MSRKKKGAPVDDSQLDLFAAPATLARVEAPASPPPSLELELFPSAVPSSAPHPDPLPASQGEGGFARGVAPSAPRPPPRPEPRGEIELPEGLRLERNLAILAGAGAGKTYSLVTMCLHLLGGARTGFEPISASELALLTFTEKAADEMRGRLRERLDALATGRAEEPTLRESFAVAGLQFPTPRRWRAIRDELGGATIGTFHSLCTQLIRRAPPNSGVSPHFELLDERDARALVRDLVERHVLARVERGSQVRTLVAEVTFGRLVEALVPIATRIREEGLAPDYVQVADGPTLRAQFESELAALVARALAIQPTTAHQREQLEDFRRAATRASFDTFEADFAAMGAATFRARAPVSELKDLAEKLSQLYAACLLAPWEAEVRELLVEISAAHEEALSSRGVLDFTGLLVQARNLLRDSLEARHDAQARFKALLVDEFQDTNRLQLEIVLLLSERRAGAPRPVSTAFEQQHREVIRLPQQPGFLAVVGDRKQSIYEFRGADVSVFEVMAKAIEAGGGGRAYLRHSRRSTAPLLEVLNRGFTLALGPGAINLPTSSPPGALISLPSSSPPGASITTPPAADFEVVYEPQHDDLLPVRTEAPGGPPVIQLTDARVSPDRQAAEVLRAADAEAVAVAIAHGLDGGWKIAAPEERTVRGGELAVLFQRFTQLEVYRQALVRHGVRHRVVRGRGFYGAQEVVDVASLLAVLADPDDALSLSAVLRSPLVGLTDSEWVSLAKPSPGSSRWALDARRVVLGDAPTHVAAVETFRQRYRALREDAERLGLRALVRVALDVFDYRVSVAAAPFGEQALANLDKLLVLATSRERQGVGVAAFARELLELADDAPKEAQGEVVDELDLAAVTLCTVHQAKGLEWPIVVLPDLATAPRGETAAVRFDREFGLGIVRPKGVTEMRSHSAVLITNQLARRARAEHLRLLYVAMTRARDRVVLGLRHPSAQVKTWAVDAAAFFPLVVAGERPEHLEVSTLTVRRVEATPSKAERASIAPLLERVRTPLAATTRAMVLPVTQLQDHASCPRRFHFAHQVGLLERPRVPPELDAEEVDVEDVRARGVAAHRLLELTPLSAISSPSLPAMLRELRRAQGLERVAGDDVLAWVERFWRTDFARTLTPERVLRELPFVLRLERADGPALLLRGQIDLLVVAPTELIVVDYKTSSMPPAGLEPYRFQLACYALAARRFVNDSLRPLRAGVAFLQEPQPEPQFFGDLDLASFGDALVGEAIALEASQRSGQWASRPRKVCESLGCGYLSRCHA